MDGTAGGFVFLCLVVGGILYIVHKVSAANADAELQKTNPELWAQKERLKLEKERLATEKKLAEEKAEREANERKVGFFLGVGRGMGWW